MLRVNRRFHELQSRDVTQYVARRIVDVIVAAQVARVVEHHATLDRVLGLELPLANQAEQEVGVVDDFVLPTEVPVLIGEGVEAVRASGDDLLDAALLLVAVEHFDVLLGEHREQRTRCRLVALSRRVQDSSSPRIANSTPAALSSRTKARATFLARSS